MQPNFVQPKIGLFGRKSNVYIHLIKKYRHTYSIGNVHNITIFVYNF